MMCVGAGGQEGGVSPGWRLGEDNEERSRRKMNGRTGSRILIIIHNQAETLADVAPPTVTSITAKNGALIRNPR